MILCDDQILRCLDEGSLVIDPFDRKCLGPNSYDVHLAPTLMTYEAGVLDCKREPQALKQRIPEQGLVLEPGELYLAATVEYTETHRHVPFLEGKSSLGRLGLCIHVTAGKGDVGFCNHWTMEITVVRPLRVYAGMPIGQLIYHDVYEPSFNYANKASPGKYNNPSKKDDPEPIPSYMYKNFTGAK